ncbi:Short-chain dehydrogenase/reductase family 16C member 6, partial [Fragariocoptes setiger]
VSYWTTKILDGISSGVIVLSNSFAFLSLGIVQQPFGARALVANNEQTTWFILKAIVLFFVPKCLRYKDVSNEIVLITGGASGLGRLMAIKFAKLGARVIIWDVNMSGLEETAKLIEQLRSEKDNVGQCHIYRIDITDREAVYSTAKLIEQQIGTVTIVVNNAGIVTGKRFLELADDKIVKTFEVNVIAHFWIIKAFLPGMMEKNHGHIVSLASIAGLVGAYQLTDYCASKFAAVGFEESLRLELACDGYDGIHSTVVCPYYIKTGMFAGVGKSLIPMLTPEYVVNETVSAVLVNQEVVCLPGVVNFLVMLKAVLPSKAFLWGHRAIGADNTMRTFVGRDRDNAPLQITIQK